MVVDVGVVARGAFDCAETRPVAIEPIGPELHNDDTTDADPGRSMRGQRDRAGRPPNGELRQAITTWSTEACLIACPSPSPSFQGHCRRGVDVVALARAQAD